MRSASVMKGPRLFSRRLPLPLLVAASGWGGRVVTSLVQLILVRLLIQSLGMQHYAVFALLAGLMNWYVISDFGVGFSLQNYISERRANNESYGDLVHAATLIGAILLLTTLVLLYLSSGWLGGLFLRQFTFLAPADKEHMFFAVGATYVAANIGGIAYKIWYAEQRGYLSNLMPALATLLGFLLTWLVTRLPVRDKLALALVAYTSPIAILALASFLFRSFLEPAPPLRDWRLLGQILRRASQFWLFALMSAGVLQVDFIVISQIFSAREIVVYMIGTKVYYLVGFFYTTALLAVWPVFTELITRRQWDNVFSLLRRYILGGIAFVVACTAGIAVTMPFIASILSPGERVTIPLLFVAALGVYHVLRVWTDSFATVLQSMSNLKALWAFVPLQAIISVLAQWTLGRRYGVAGVVAGLILSYLLTVSWALPGVVLRHTRKSLPA